MSEVRWIKTTADVYHVVYNTHSEALVVFGTHTCMDGCYFHGKPHIMTEWGFKDADYPLIKCEGVGPHDAKVWRYWIAQPEASDE